LALNLITGGSRGLGLALVQQLLQEGERVIEFSRSAPHPFSVRADLSEPLAFASTVAATLAALDRSALEGGIRIIHNAGLIEPIGPAAGQAPAAQLANLNANLCSAVLGLSAMVAALQDVPGRKCLLSISSGAAQRPIAGWSLYCTAKAGLEMFVRTLAQEQSQESKPFIAVNVNPGVIDTEMQATLRAAGPEAFPDHAVFVARHAEGQLQSPAAVATRVLAIARRNDLVGGERYDASAPPR